MMTVFTPILLISLLIAANGQDTAIFAYQVLKLLSLPLLDGLDSNYTCPTPSSPTKRLNDFHIRGTSLGGWLVLEPWITPSLFYQFLGPRLANGISPSSHHRRSVYVGASKRWGDLAKDHVGLDSLTFCTALGTCTYILHVRKKIIRNDVITRKQGKRKQTDS